MTITQTVHIAQLYPSDIEDVSKPFRNATRIHEPYTIRFGDTEKNLIHTLIKTIEITVMGGDLERNRAPYSGHVNFFVDAVNKTLSPQRPEIAQQVPEFIRYLQLAHFMYPELNGATFSYGLLSHYGKNATFGKQNEFALLLPHQRDTTTPAILLSNNNDERHVDQLERMVSAIQYTKPNLAK